MTTPRALARLAALYDSIARERTTQAADATWFERSPAQARRILGVPSYARSDEEGMHWTYHLPSHKSSTIPNLQVRFVGGYVSSFIRQ